MSLISFFRLGLKIGLKKDSNFPITRRNIIPLNRFLEKDFLKRGSFRASADWGGEVGVSEIPWTRKEGRRREGGYPLGGKRRLI